ncbi:MAG TPA: flippase-like domain-containing protein, partial [Anaerolineae bacterium]|nr:flippase-like domain-containing protein [Anaerolineae bacterium]
VISTLSQTEQRTWLRRGQSWAGILLGLISVILLVNMVDLRLVWETLRAMRFSYLALAFAIVVLNALEKGLRWQLLLYPRHRTLSYGHALGLLLAGQAINLAVPARVGDLARAYLAGEHSGERKAWLLGTIAGEKMLDVLLLVLLFFTLLPLMAFPQLLAERAVPLAALGMIVIAGSAIVLMRRVWLLRALNWAASRLPYAPATALLEQLDIALSGLDVFGYPRIALALWGLSLVNWGLGAATNLVLFLAFGLPASLLAAWFLLLVLQTGVAIPAAPGKVGVFHLLCVFALGVFGVDQATALGYGIALHMIAIAPAVLGGMGYYWWTIWRVGKLRARQK